MLSQYRPYLSVEPFAVDVQLDDPEAALRTTVQWWAETYPRAASACRAVVSRALSDLPWLRTASLRGRPRFRRMRDRPGGPRPPPLDDDQELDRVQGIEPEVSRRVRSGPMSSTARPVCSASTERTMSAASSGSTQ
jgi:hypothetical protein